jgi:hypothetical protein
MSFAPSSPVTGAAQTGFTSPTYTLTADTAPDTNGKQYAITAIGGTQTGVTVHSMSSPFTVTFERPKVIRMVGVLNSNGVLINNPKNISKFRTRKGVTPAAGQNAQMLLIETFITVPAGADTYDAANVRAAISAHAGVLSQVSAGVGDTVVSGVL